MSSETIEAKVTESKPPTAGTYYGPGSCFDRPSPASVVASTPEQAALLIAQDWMPAEEFWAPMRAREAETREQSAKAAAAAQKRAEQQEKVARAAREKSEAERKVREAEEQKRKAEEAEREARDQFLVRVYRSVVDPGHQRRIRVRDELNRIANELSSHLSGGWDSSFTVPRVEQALEFEQELDSIAERERAAEKQLSDARAKERQRWQSNKH